MSSFNKGSSRKFRRQELGTLRDNRIDVGTTRKGKQSKQGPRKGSRPPGNFARQIKR